MELPDSPFRPEQTPEANGAILKCRVSPANKVAWWATVAIASTLTQAEADVLVNSLRAFLSEYVK